MKHILCPTFIVLLVVNCVQAAEVPFVEIEGNAAVFSPDGKKIVTVCGDSIVRILDTESGRELKQWEERTSIPRSTAFSPDGKKIVTAGGFGNIAQIRNADTGEVLQTFEGHTFVVHTAAFSPDGKKIITAGDTTARIWDVDSIFP